MGVAFERGALAAARQRDKFCVAIDQGGEIAVEPGESSIAQRSEVRLLLLGRSYTFDGADGMLEAYLSGGCDSVISGDGSFLALVIDDRSNEIHVITDPVGTRAAYLWERRVGYTLTNRIADGPATGRGLDAAGICSYLVGDGTRAGLTPFAGVESLPGGTVATIANGRVQPRRYWRIQPSFADEGAVSIDELEKQMLEHMRQAVARRLAVHRDLDIMISLSGGVDSKGLLGLLTEAIDPSRIEAFTYFHGEQVGDMDLPEATRVARIAGVRHRAVAGFSGDFLATLVDNALSGDSMAHFCDDADSWRALSPGEERLVVAGDRQWHGLGSQPDALPTVAMLGFVSLFPVSAISWFLDRLPENNRRALADGWQSVFDARVAHYETFESWLMAVQPAYVHERVKPTLMLWRELFSQQVGPVVNPYLDRALLDFVAALPQACKDLESPNFLHRRTLTNAFPELFARGSSHGGWNMPNWGAEMRRHGEVLKQWIAKVDSPLEELIPKDVTLGLIEEVGKASPSLSTATDGWRWKVKRVVKTSKVLRNTVRRARLGQRVRRPQTVAPAAMLRRVLTLHLALADAEEVLSIHEETKPR